MSVTPTALDNLPAQPLGVVAFLVIGAALSGWGERDDEQHKATAELVGSERTVASHPRPRTDSVMGWGWKEAGLTIQAGTLSGSDVRLEPVAQSLRVADIRNCSSSTHKPVATVSAEDPVTHRGGLWLFDLGGPNVRQLRGVKDGVLGHAIDPTGGLVAYVAPSATSRTSSALYIHDIATDTSSLVVGVGVSAATIPSWSPASTTIVYHTDVERGGRRSVHEVVELDRETNKLTVLFEGEAPAVSPAGDRIAYQRDGAVHVWNRSARTSTSIPLRWRGELLGGMTWSPDGALLLVGQRSGVTGKRTTMFAVHVATGKRTEIKEQLLGLRFLVTR